MHTIEFSNGGSDIQILRVAVYEEQWISPANLSDERYLYLVFDYIGYNSAMSIQILLNPILYFWTWVRFILLCIYFMAYNIEGNYPSISE